MWWFLATVLGAVLVWQWKTRGPSAAVGTTILLSLLTPTWLKLDVWVLPVDLRSLAATVALGLYCLHRESTYRTKLTLADFAVVGLFLLHIVSNSLADGFDLGIVCRAYAQWVIPYLAGRAAMRRVDDVEALRSTACGVAIALASWAAWESLSGENPANTVFGERPTDRTPRVLERWNLKRAEGPTTHPIWMGMIQVLLVPWTISAAARAYRGEGRKWQLAAPFCSALGIFCTVSRGPWAVMLLTLYGVAVCRLPRARKWLLAGGAATGLVAFVAGERLTEAVQRLTSKGQSQGLNIIVDGVERPYNETTHRLVLFHIYREAMQRAGLVGFGTDRTESFPVRVPLGKVDKEVIKNVWTIDNEYILMQLRFGALGVLCLVLAHLGAGIATIRRGIEPGPGRESLFAAAIGSLILSVALALSIEWMAYDFGFFLFWTLGAAGGFHVAADLGLKRL
jgi:hypothetical protein